MSIPDIYFTERTRNKTEEICISLPPKVNSHGLLDNLNSPSEFLKFSLPLLELQMGLIFIISQALHFVLKRIGITLFVSQLLTGLILGPTFLGHRDFMRNVLFTHDSQDTINAAAMLGYSMFLFLTAVKMDVEMVLKSGKGVMIIGIVSVITPLIIGLCYQKIFVYNNITGPTMLHESMAVTGVQPLTCFPVIAYLIGELKIANSELGRVALSSAVFSDIFGITLVMIMSFMQQTVQRHAAGDIGAIVVFVFVVFFILRPIMVWMVKKTPQGRPVNSSYVYIVIGIAFVSQFYFNVFNQVEFLGPVIFGFAVPAGPPLGSALVDKFETVILGLILPLFVATSMMRADIWLIVSGFSRIKFSFIAIILCSVVKLVACLTPPLFFKMPPLDSLALALIMSSKGIVELCVYVVFRDAQAISDEFFSTAAFFILLNAMIIPILVRNLYDPFRKYAGYQARNIGSLKSDSELRILACIHRPDNVASVIRLLEAFYPTKESPIGVYVLHLIELVGRATPFFITHAKHKLITDSHSENVILAFNQYERDNWGIATVHAFTAISPVKLMEEDICMLAFDKLTSLILLPFHRKWSIDGSIESEDDGLRAVNCKVFEKAPCSVGIFLDRGKFVNRTMKTSPVPSLSVCMIFFGGCDCREALILAKRMAKDSNVSLTVVNFTPETVNHKWEEMRDRDDKMLDSLELRDVKHNTVTNAHVVYVEEAVKDGPQTALIIRSLADVYDIFIVGRRYGIESQQTTGLSEWTEFPELGVIGDLLASKDLNSRASVLVLQHQKRKQTK